MTVSLRPDAQIPDGCRRCAGWDDGPAAEARHRSPPPLRLRKPTDRRRPLGCVQRFQQQSCGQGVSVVVYLQMLFVVISAAVMHMLEWQDPAACEAWLENETASPL